MASQKKSKIKEKSGSAFIYFIVGVAVFVLVVNLVSGLLANGHNGGAAEVNDSDEINEVSDATNPAAAQGGPDDPEEINKLLNNGDESESDKNINDVSNSGDEDSSDSDEDASKSSETEESTSAAAIKNGEHVFSLPQLANGDYEVSIEGGIAVYEFSEEDAISVMPADNADMINASYGKTSDVEISVGGVTGTENTGISAKDGSAITYLLIPQGSNVLFVRGSAAFLEDVKTNLSL